MEEEIGQGRVDYLDSDDKSRCEMSVHIQSHTPQMLRC